MPDSKSATPSAPRWQPSSPAVSADVFEDLIAGDKVLVHFWAPWNPYDKPFDANLQQLRGKYPRLRIYSANTDETGFTPITQTHCVVAFPALICFANGRALGRFYGVETLEKLEAFLKEMAEPSRR